MHGSSFPQRGDRPKATAQQDAGELYSGLYARNRGVPRAGYGAKSRCGNSPATPRRTFLGIVPAQTLRVLIIHVEKVLPGGG